ncbi:FtsX-like permease family protein [Cellulomonas sp.]|uniref:FtsX-like permease family protein n=1 Tax=Cellulomonas sp. TaxID=40001 RepID=UPI002811BBC5|nr:FtsX-like permease family protein [Cellulomonas sp.]
MVSGTVDVPRAAAWRPALLLARRDAARHRVRTGLVLVPVTVAAAMSALVATTTARALVLASPLGPGGVLHYVDPAAIGTMATAAALAVVLVVVLVAPAHLVGLHRRLRELRALEAVGATRADLRRVVVAPAALVAATGAVLGCTAALAVTLRTMRPEGPLDVLVGLLATTSAGVVTVVAATAAAWLPARRLVLRPEALAAAPVPRRTALLGAGGGALTVGGGALAGWAAREAYALVVVGAAAVAHVGLVVLLGALLGTLDRLPVRGVATRFVLRDAARHRLRALAAVAACATVVAGATAALVYTWSSHGQQADWSGLERSGALSVVVDTRDGATHLAPGPTMFDDPVADAALVVAAVAVVLLATWATAALAAQESAADLATLDAVGVDRRTRRRIAAGQAGLVATVGAWTGVPAGLALGALLVTAYRYAPTSGGPVTHHLVAPVGAVAALLVLLPLVVTAAAALLPQPSADGRPTAD